MNAALLTDCTDQIAAARTYAEGMVEQRHWLLAGYGFGEVAKLEKHLAWLKGAPSNGNSHPD